MAIDYGARRVGIAVSDSGTIATPHSVLRNEGDIVETLAALAGELGAETIVVGIARNEQKFHRLAEPLRQKTCKTVGPWDEALTTGEAAQPPRPLRRRPRDRR